MILKYCNFCNQAFWLVDARSYENNVYNVELFDWTDSCRVAANELSINERLVHEGLALGLTVHKVVSKNPTSSPPAEGVLFNEFLINLNEQVKS